MPIMLCTINKYQASFLVLYVLDSYLYILTASLRDVFIETKIQKCNLTILLTFIAPVFHYMTLPVSLNKSMLTALVCWDTVYEILY